MNPKLLVIALITALGSGCASTDKNRMAYQIMPVSTVSHGAAGAPSYYQLARYYHGQKRYDLAEDAYKKSLAIDGGQVAAWNALGSLNAERGDLVAAVQHFEKALKITPNAGYIHNNLGFAYFLQGQVDKAYDTIRKALTFDPTLERGWANLEQIAVAQSNSRLAAVVKLRQVPALPPTLLANSSVDMAVPSAVGSTPSVVARTEPTTASSPSTVTVIDASTGRTTLAKPDKAVVLVVASSASSAVSPSPFGNNSEKFVVVSTSREVVNLALAEPNRDAKLEPPVVQPEPISVAKSEPVSAVKPEPAPVMRTEPIAVTKDVPLVIAKAESKVLPTETPAAKPATDIDLSRIKIEVTNANGISGFAKKFSAQLRQDHIPVRRITNYTSFLLKGTVIEYQPGYLDAAKALKDRTRIDADLTQAKSARANSDLRIVLGKNAM